MPPLRRPNSNGRSPLVRKQRQITTFFSPGNDSCESESPGSGFSLSTPAQVKPEKPFLAISASPASYATPESGQRSSEKTLFRNDVVGRRIRVFWPLDKAWYVGKVKSFNEGSGKHTILYEDAEEEVLDLRDEKFELLEGENEGEGVPRRRSRLRRLSGPIVKSFSFSDAEVFQDSEDECSIDDEWKVCQEKDEKEDDLEEMELKEEEEDDLMVCSRRSQIMNSTESKRKKVGLKNLGCAKKIKVDKDCEKNASMTHSGNDVISSLDTALADDATERFVKREAEKLHFLGKGRMDSCRRKPGDVGYDPNTLYLPLEFLRSLSGGQRQWWEFKSKHMDKVLFFKMGKFYELFEMDAHIGASELDLQYMKGEQPHCGFPEKNLSANLEKLAKKGYRVLVIEQTETPEQLEARRKEMGSKDKVVNREICAVVTKGTLMEGEMLMNTHDTSYLMSITESCQLHSGLVGDVVIGICLVDVSTSKFLVGQFVDDSERNFLCSIFSEFRPVEIIIPSELLSQETERVLKINTRNPLINILVPLLEFWNSKKTVEEIKIIYNSLMDSKASGLQDQALTHSNLPNSNNVVHRLDQLPDVLIELVKAEADGCHALSALGGCIYYLRQAFLDVRLLKCAVFEKLPSLGFNLIQQPYMILDAAALENLEILENNIDGGSSGTLFAQLDQCVTAFGKRLLKSWLVRPLYDTGLILGRQDAIVVFKSVGLPVAMEFRKKLSRLPDMERLLSRVFSNSKANGRNGCKAVLYEDAAKKQLQEFISVLQGCQEIFEACFSLGSVLTLTESDLLHYLLTPGKGLPDISVILKYFKEAFNWSDALQSGRIIPQEGCDVEYDIACKLVSDMESNFDRYLKEQRFLIGDVSINYVTVGKEVYLLEVPESVKSRIPTEYELRSSKKGYFRYWTPKLKKWIRQLSEAETNKDEKLRSILQRLIEHFSDHHVKWRLLLSAVAELDVLISFAIGSNLFEGPRCRPSIQKISRDNKFPYIFSKGLGHPILRSDGIGKGSFVPNDVSIGGVGRPSFLLLSGPNMGGKSTLLRQVCLATILAQVGADVPAESFDLSPVDRIFVRMGAKDHIMAGQSTFFTELSETSSILSSATKDSLVALDELGRGTSTSDGQAIAGSVLEYLVHKIQCRGLFSTHYHRLALEYAKDSKVSLCHMACKVRTGPEGVEEVTFLYRLSSGSCPRSYGPNVARLAGMPVSVLQRAVEMSSQFETLYGKKNMKKLPNFLELLPSSINGDIISILEEILDSLDTWKNSHVEDSQAFSHMCSLQRKIQQRATLLLL